MSFSLSVNTNPFVNRFAEPGELIRVIAGECGLGHVQMVHEFLTPDWPAPVLSRLTRSTTKACADTGAKVTSMMTGPYGRLNHFGHPDADVRAHHVGWFQKLADLAADIGCPAIGTQFAIMTFADYDEPARREALLGAALDCWRKVAEHAARRGLTWLFWEPMSVGREFGHTIAATKQLQLRIDAAKLPIPLRPMVDIDHGDVASPNPADIDPFAWAREFAVASPIIHIKQSSMNKGGHWPFTAHYNRDGRITPDKLLAAIREGGGRDNELCLELAFREREPADRSVIPAIAESVAYWAPYADTGLKARR